MKQNANRGWKDSKEWLKVVFQQLKNYKIFYAWAEAIWTINYSSFASLNSIKFANTSSARLSMTLKIWTLKGQNNRISVSSQCRVDNTKFSQAKGYKIFSCDRNQKNKGMTSAPLLSFHIKDIGSHFFTCFIQQISVYCKHSSCLDGLQRKRCKTWVFVTHHFTCVVWRTGTENINSSHGPDI